MHATALLRVAVMKTAANLSEARFAARDTLGLGLPPVVAGTGGVIAANEAGLDAEGAAGAGLGAGALASMAGAGRRGLMSRRENSRAAGHARDSKALKATDPDLSVLHSNKAHEHASNSEGHFLRAEQHGTMALPQALTSSVLMADDAISEGPKQGPVSTREEDEFNMNRKGGPLSVLAQSGSKALSDLAASTVPVGTAVKDLAGAGLEATKGAGKVLDSATGIRDNLTNMGRIITGSKEPLIPEKGAGGGAPVEPSAPKPASGGVAPSQEAKKEEAPPAPGADTKGPPASEKAPFFSRKAWADAGWTPGRVAGVGGAVGATALLAYLLSKNEKGPKKRRIKPEGRALLAGALAP